MYKVNHNIKLINYVNTEDKTTDLNSSIWHSKAEYYCYEILYALLDKEYYKIFPHIHMIDIDSSSNEDIRNRHVDFLITNNWGQPILAIEINGTHHVNSEYIKQRDTLVEKFLYENEIPTLFIPITEMKHYSKEEYEKSYIDDLSEFIIDFIKPYTLHINTLHYCDRCGNRMNFYYNKGYQGRFYLCTSCKEPTTDKPYIHDAKYLDKPTYVHPIFRLEKEEA